MESVANNLHLVTPCHAFTHLSHCETQKQKWIFSRSENEYTGKRSMGNVFSNP